jgi:hypothetical protein
MAVSNSEGLYTHYQKLFLKSDHIKTAEKLHLKYDKTQIHIPLFNHPFTINRHTANITSPLSYKNNECYIEKLLILHHLYFHKPDAKNSQNMVPFRNIRECADFEIAYQKTTITPFTTYFNKKPQLLKKQAIAIGGQINSHGDVSFTINAFPLIPLQFIFWDSDEELPANTNILFDKNIAQFIHPESIPVLANFGTKLLMGNSSK